jgi:superkiller protein 3
MQLHQLPEALNAFNRALDLIPDNFNAWMRKGIVLVLLHQLPEALNAFDHALDIDPEETGFLFFKSLIHCTLKQYSEAFSTNNSVLTIDPQHEAALAFKEHETTDDLDELSASASELVQKVFTEMSINLPVI